MLKYTNKEHTLLSFGDLMSIRVAAPGDWDSIQVGPVRDAIKAYIEAGGVAEPFPLPSMDDLKAAKLAEINLECDKAISAIRATYPETEVLSWPKQETEARALLADEAAATPLVDTIASGRGLTRRELAERIVAKADAFAVVSGAAIGKRQALEDQLNDAETPEQVEAIAW